MKAFEIPKELLSIEDGLHAWASSPYASQDIPEDLRERIDRLKADGPPAIDELYLAMREQESIIHLLEEEERALAAKRERVKLTHARWRELMLEIVMDCFGGKVKGVYKTYTTREKGGKIELVIR